MERSTAGVNTLRFENSRSGGNSYKPGTSHSSSGRSYKLSTSHSSSGARSRTSKCNSCGGAWPHKDKCPAIGKTCKNCGGKDHFANQQRCPASGKTCTNCNNLNHIAGVCRQKKATRSVQIQEEHSNSDSESEYVWKLKNDAYLEQPISKVNINGTHIPMLADSGATVNVLCSKDVT